MPVIVIIDPIQHLADGFSCKNKIENTTVIIGIKVVISIAIVGLSLFIAIKNKVSPSDIPSIPLIINGNNTLYSKALKPLINNNIAIHRVAIILLPIFIPIGETFRPIFL
jgi:hypothetical protein